MNSYNDPFVRDDEHATRIAADLAVGLWEDMAANGAHERRVPPPPWLQGMSITVHVTAGKRWDGGDQTLVTATLAPSAINSTFAPLAVTSRLASPVDRETFVGKVSELVLGCLQEADRRVPGQRLADMVWRAGLHNTSAPLYGAFMRERALKCVELGLPFGYASLAPEGATQLIEWFGAWAAEHQLAVPTVEFNEGWITGAIVGDRQESAEDIVEWLRVARDDGAFEI